MTLSNQSPQSKEDQVSVIACGTGKQVENPKDQAGQFCSLRTHITSPFLSAFPWWLRRVSIPFWAWNTNELESLWRWHGEFGASLEKHPQQEDEVPLTHRERVATINGGGGSRLSVFPSQLLVLNLRLCSKAEFVSDRLLSLVEPPFF